MKTITKKIRHNPMRIIYGNGHKMTVLFCAKRQEMTILGQIIVFLKKNLEIF